MKTMKRVKTAVIGCGAISDIYFQNMINNFEILEVAGCCDLNRAAAARAADTYGIPVMSMEEILADPEVEMVVNLTNPAAHYALNRELLQCKKHVYSEKVVAADIAQGRELLELSKAQGRLLCSAPDTFLGAAVQTARYLVETGMIGAVTSCVAVLQRDAAQLAEKFPYTARPLGGIGLDVGIYYTTALINILGAVTEVCGMSGTMYPEQVHYFAANDNFGECYRHESETYLMGNLRFENGCIGSLHFNSRSIRTETPYVLLYGTEGILKLPDPNFFGGEVQLILKGQTVPVNFPLTHGYCGNDRGLGAAEMAWSLRKGRLPRANAAMALHAMEILTGVMESSEAGRFYRMTTEFERTPGIPKGYPGAEYANNQAEMGLYI